MESNQEKISQMKEEYITLLNSVKREGIDKLIEFLTKSDFFSSPSSTRFHGAYQGGLLEHSLNVYKNLLQVLDIPIFKEKCKDISKESIILCPLLHDICKVFYYTEDVRNVKNKETGKWEQVPFYTVDNKILIGEHGDKSVIMLLEFIKLLPDEKLAIRWHMGAYEGNEIWNVLGEAYEKCPFAMALHFADMISTHISEVQ